LKEIAVQLCTCTWIEILTGIGITAYLVLVIQDIGLAAITAGLFSPLIGFHFAVSKTSGKNDFAYIHKLKFKNPSVGRD